MYEQQQSRWRPTREQLLWAGGIVAVVFAATVLCGYLFGWKWTGLPKRTLWDWLDLLIVPVVLAIGGYLFTRSENQATQRAAEQRAQDEALQAYLDGMAQLLTDKERPLHRAQPGDSLSSVARARTLTVLPRLDGDRKARVVQFLYESGLIAGARPILDLSEADLSGAILRRSRLFRANLFQANLTGADLSRGANLSYADLSYANLSGADLSLMANLSYASLIGANLSRANLSYANLAEATITEPPYGEITDEAITADLSYANLSGAILNRADLRGAILHGATGWTEEQLVQAKSLERATMPNGQKYEDWLTSRGEENSGS